MCESVFDAVIPYGMVYCTDLPKVDSKNLKVLIDERWLRL